MATMHTRTLLPDPPSNPNLPSGTTSLPLHPITLWPIGSIPSVLVFPGELNADTLIIAIKQVAAIWPNVAGRYVKHEEGRGLTFSIDLTSSPIPFETQEIDSSTVFSNLDVVQPTLDPYLPALPLEYYKPNIDSSLIAFRLTTLTSSSILGIRWAHILGDASSAHRFLQHLSACYVGRPIVETPSFFLHINLPIYPPSPEVIEQYDIAQIQPWVLRDAFAAYGAAAAASEPVTIRLSRREIGAMRAECGGQSDQDAISAWWTTLLRRRGAVLRRMIYTYRTLQPNHPSFPPNLPTLAANVAQMRSIDLPSSAAEIATVIRTELSGPRDDPKATLEWLSVAAYRLEQGAVDGLAQMLVPSEDEVMVNSNLRYDWNVKFGFEDAVYHTSFSTVRFLRVFQANPRTNQVERDVELCFNVATGTSEAVHELVEEDKSRWRVM